jgi:hypothetical protein
MESIGVYTVLPLFIAPRYNAKLAYGHDFRKSRFIYSNSVEGEAEAEAEAEAEEKIRLKQYVSLRSKGRHNYKICPSKL